MSDLTESAFQRRVTGQLAHAAVTDCENCHKCLQGKTVKSGQFTLAVTNTRMILCPICGCKRCPKASNCALECTDSNKPGQTGSVYA
jgi:hypothetical protein